MLTEIYGCDDDTRIVEEMGIWSGSVRIDIAVINGELSGFEIKSDKDTLDRLPLQCELYSKVFDKLSLVVGSRHEEKARSLIPDWWGITIATIHADAIKLNFSREPMANPSPDPLLVAQLLWRDEAIAILQTLGMAKGWKSKTAKAVHQHLAETLPFAELSQRVRDTLKLRRGWLRQSIGDERQVAICPNFHPRSPAS